MKNKKKFILIMLTVCVAAWGVDISYCDRGKEIINLTLSNIESLARYELPEVEITCGSLESTGRCWAGDCEPFFTPFGMAKVWDCYQATGNPNDVCVQDAPCL